MSKLLINNTLKKFEALKFAGRVSEAWQLCERLYSKYPTDKAVVVALVDIEESLGRFKRSHRILRTILKQSQGDEARDYKRLLGDSYHKSGYYWRALRAYRSLLKESPDCAEFSYQIALILVDIKHTKRSFPYFDKAIELSPDSVEYQLTYAKVKYDACQYQDAVSLYQLAEKKVRPELRDSIQLNIVLCYFLLGDKSKAASLLLSKPENCEITEADISTLKQKAKYYKGLGLFDHLNYLCSFINGFNPSSESLLVEADLECENGGYSGAFELIKRAEAEGGSTNLLLNFHYAHYYSCICEYDIALDYIDRCIKEAGESVDFLLLKAVILEQSFDLDGALKVYETILAYDTENKDARWGCATIGFAKGRWGEAFDHQRYRKFIALDKKSLNDRFPYIKEWDGKEQISSLLVVDEQGVGDHIRYAKFYPCLKDKVRSLHLVTDLRLRDLYHENFGELNMTQRLTLPPYREIVDSGVRHYIASADLGRLFYKDVFSKSLVDFTLDKVPGYLAPDKSIMKEMEVLIKATKAPIYIGVCWRGPVFVEGRAHWYIDIEQIKAIFQGIQEQVVLVSLQHGASPDELQALTDFGFAQVVVSDVNLKDDFNSMAGIISNLDLVISPATAVCELAGAIGTPVWMFATRERPKWNLEGSYMKAFYPNMTIHFSKTTTETTANGGKRRLPLWEDSIRVFNQKITNYLSS